jgi:4-amino-4-deoxy-L-arabinose transferase-like glycosyltransferase
VLLDSPAASPAGSALAAGSAGPAGLAGSRPVGWAVAGAALRWALRLAVAGYGLFMSLWRLDVPAWANDERVYAAAGRDYWHGQFTYNPEHPPLGKWLIGLSEKWFGTGAWAVRLPAAVAMLAVGLLLWVWLARRVGGAAGVVAALVWWSLPAISTFPEVMGGQPDLSLSQRLALLDPLAAAFAVGALVAGWWWVRSGRLRAALLCGLLAGAAVATKIPAVLLVAVPAVVGPLGTLRHAPPWWASRARLPNDWALPASWQEWTVRLGRVAVHAVAWLTAGFAAFAAAYAPMGARQAVRVFAAGWRYQHRHGTGGHDIVLRGAVWDKAPWWALGWWQYMSVGAAVTVVAVLATLAGLAVRSGLTAYLTAAWLLPMALLVPVSGLALPHYDLVWRPVLVAGCVAGGAVAAGRLRRWVPRPLVALLVLAALVPPALLGARTAAYTARLVPEGYAALPQVAFPGQTLVIGNVLLARQYLPGWSVIPAAGLPPSHHLPPGTIVLDRARTLRAGDRGLGAWARLNGYRLVRSGTLDIWVRR